MLSGGSCGPPDTLAKFLGVVIPETVPNPANPSLEVGRVFSLKLLAKTPLWTHDALKAYEIS